MSFSISFRMGSSHPINAQMNLVETLLNNSNNGNHLGIDAQNSLQLLQNPFNPPTSENNFNVSSIVRKDFITPLSSGLIQSKGSKKWIDDHPLHNDVGDENAHHLLASGQQPVNRNFLSRLIGNVNSGQNQQQQHGPFKYPNDCGVEGNEDDSSILDVVDNNNHNGQNKGGNMVQNQLLSNDNHQFGNTSSFQEQISQLSSLSNLSQYTQNSLNNFANSYCGQGSEMSADTEGMGVAATTGTGSVPGNATASLLVEAALNSVTNMIDGHDHVDDCNAEGIKDRSVDHSQATSINAATEDAMENVHHMGSGEGIDSSIRNETGSYNSGMQDIDTEVKLMKGLNDFQLNQSAQMGPHSTGNGQMDNMQFPLSQQSSSTSSTNGNTNVMQNCQNSDMMHDNEIDVDNASTPRTVDRDSTSFRNYPPTTTPSPRDISPGQDYAQSQRTADQQQQFFGIQRPTATGRNNNYHHMNDPMSAAQSPLSHSHANQHNPSPPIIPRYGFSLNEICRKREYGGQSSTPSMLLQQQQSQQTHLRREQHLSSDEDSIIAQNLSVNHGLATPTVSGTDGTDQTQKCKLPVEHYSKYSDHLNSVGGGTSGGLADLRLKYNSNENADHFQRFHPSSAGQQGNHNNPNSATAGSDHMNELGLDMSSRIGSYPHHNFQLSAAAAAGLNRYHHHIYDILSERDTQQSNQQTHALQNSTDHQLQLQQEQQHNLMLSQHQQEQAATHQMSDSLNVSGNHAAEGLDQTTSVDLSRTTSYVVTSPPSLPYGGHPHSDMLRMVSMELNGSNGNGGLPGNGGNIIAGNNHRSFLSGATGSQHNPRMDTIESLHHHHHRLLTSAEQHRLLASNTAAAAEQLTTAGGNRLLVDPTHLLMDSNNRSILSASADTSRILGDRHMVQGRDFGTYHHHQVAAAAANNYHHHGAVHHPLARPSTQSNHHSVGASNYHPFPTYY